MSKYLQSLRNKRDKKPERVPFRLGGNFNFKNIGRSKTLAKQARRTVAAKKAEEVKKKGERLAKKEMAKTGLAGGSNYDSSYLTTGGYTLSNNRPTIPIPDLPDAKTGLAENQANDSEFLTADQDVKQLNEAPPDIETRSLDVPEIEAAPATTTSTVEAPEKVEAATMDVALAQDFSQAASDLMEVPTGEAATLLKKVQPQTVAQAASELTGSGVGEGLSQAIATDPVAAMDQIGGTDLESQTNIADLPKEALVTTQLNGLLAEMEEGKTPLWAQPAVDQVNQMMASRGLNASTLGRDALFSAIIQSALPIAESNAQALQKRASEKLAAAVTFKTQEAEFEQQMALANLSNQQQAFIQERNFRQQTILSNQSATNASRQFNATNQQQADQFMASLEANVEQFNSQAENAMKQFNVTEQNKIAALNAGNRLQASQFEEQQRVDTLKFIEQQNFARESWNAANAQAVEQSNMTWRRNTNTAATAAQNAANQLNVQNAYNMSALQQTQLWQQLRDEATYARTAFQNEEQRKTALIQTAIGQESVMKNDTRGKESRDQVAKWLDTIS